MTGAVGMGLDINALVSKLVSAEGAVPKARLNKREAVLNYKLSALGQLKSALAEFQGKLGGLVKPESFQQRSATSNNKDLFTVSASSAAAAGKHNVEVVRLAKAHKVISGGFENNEAVIGSGTLTLKLGDQSIDINIDESNNTLAGIRDAINAADISPKVSAAILNVDEGGETVSKLVLTSSATGKANEIEISVSEDPTAPGLARLSNLTEVEAAEDALIRVDGQNVTRSSNTIGDAIEGVTITLLKAEEGAQASLSVQLDREAAKRNVTAFVEGYNKLMTALRGLSGYDAEKSEAGPLLGDATLRSIATQLQRELGTPALGAAPDFRTLAEIGISTERDGTLKIDNVKLDKAFDTSYDQIGELFAGEGGLAIRLEGMFKGLLAKDGPLESRISSMQDRSKDIAKDRERLELRLEQVERRYLSQFTALDILLNQLQGTSDYLGQQLQSLPGMK